MPAVRFTSPFQPDIVATRCSVEHQDRRRSYTLVRPKQAEPAPALVLVLHGTLQTGDSIREFSAGSFDAFAAAGALVAYPDAARREWNGARKAAMVSRSAKSVDDVGFLRELAESLCEQWGADRERVYCIGFSLGGQMAIRLLHGAALIASTQPDDDNLVVENLPVAAVPVIAIHGTADPLTPYDGGHVSFRGLFRKGLHLSAEATARYYAVRNGIDTEPAVSDHGHSVLRTDYRQAGKPPVSLITMVDGGHQIPGASTGNLLVFGPRSEGVHTAETIAGFFGLSVATGPTTASSGVRH
jgi:polyhydroxybutyrate depolymerase